MGKRIPVEAMLAAKQAEKLEAKVRQHLIDRAIEGGRSSMCALAELIPRLDPLCPAYGPSLVQAFLWCHLGLPGFDDFLCEQLPRVTVPVERALPVSSHLQLELARGVALTIKNDFNAASEVLQRIVDAPLSREDPFLLVIGRYYLARCQRRMGFDAKAFDNLELARAMALAAGWLAMVAVIDIARAWLIFQLKHSHKIALNLLNESRTRLQDRDVTGVVYALMVEARISRRIARPDLAIQALENAIGRLPAGHPVRPRVLKELTVARILTAASLQTSLELRTAQRNQERAVVDAFKAPIALLERYGMADQDLRGLANDSRVEKFLNKIADVMTAIQLTSSDDDRGKMLTAIQFQLAEARRNLEEAKPLYVVLENKRGLAVVDLHLGRIALDSGVIDEAATLARAVWAAARVREDSYLAVRAAILLCRVMLTQFEDSDRQTKASLDEAIEAGNEAVAGATALENARLIIRANTWLGCALMANATLGNVEHARRCLDAANRAVPAGVERDYVFTDLDRLNRLLSDSSDEKALVELLREMQGDLRHALRTRGKTRRSLSSYQDSFIDIIRAAALKEGPRGRVLAVMGVSGSVQGTIGSKKRAPDRQ